MAVHVLMGGEDRTDWASWPERDAVLIGTQDMLLSRALNRGYAASRARWPIEFALLNNDCLWVFDEVQLMGSALATSSQLDAFRNGGKQRGGFGVYGSCRSLWMSATIQPDWLDTVDHMTPDQPALGLSAEEKRDRASEAGRRLNATKKLIPARNRLDKKATALSAEILETHIRRAAEARAMTLAVVNTVERATRLHNELRKIAAKRKLTVDLLLVHSRFRPPDRRAIVDRLRSDCPEGGRIVVSTQVVEAGVDISAGVLFTDVAPWASLVQRFGRCNRKGDINGAEVYWVDVDDPAPYPSDDVADARKILSRIQVSEVNDVGPASLPPEKLLYRPLHVLRRKDMVDLFDTTPDLAGNDIDISRFLRDGDDHDVYVFWRNVGKGASPDDTDEAPPRREELCPVSAPRFRDFVAGNDRVWRWDFLDDRWRTAEQSAVHPGQTFLVASDAGGYSPELGWHARNDGPVNVVEREAAAKTEQSTDDEPLSRTTGCWQSIAEHTDDVCRELAQIVGQLPIGAASGALAIAARWHDWGKAHGAFQAKLRPDCRSVAEARAIYARAGGFVAKAPSNCWSRWNQRAADAEGSLHRPHFRHELASALGIFVVGTDILPDELRSLVAYLVAAHHGKVRLSIRSLPGERKPPTSRGDTPQFARGVWDGDVLPIVDLGGGVQAPETALSLESMQLGLSDADEPSWVARMLEVRDELGVFRLAYLESLLRAADWRASDHADAIRGPQNG
ncbi:MAG TPA: CRISPR-associated endonuclease Cas3'' [Pirellulales bacterium]|nr:CRISPR-associated endonuclease Cas3'' [Pirellulales bacterium]